MTEDIEEPDVAYLSALVVGLGYVGTYILINF
jgi:hypothetical protein